MYSYRWPLSHLSRQLLPDLPLDVVHRPLGNQTKRSFPDVTQTCCLPIDFTFPSDVSELDHLVPLFTYHPYLQFLSTNLCQVQVPHVC